MALSVATGCTGAVTGMSGDDPQPGSVTEEWRSGLFRSGTAYGNGKLWVGGLWTGGVIEVGSEFVGPKGGAKFGWWRAVPGTLRITGRRLDGAAPPLRANVPDGYGDRGFQSSGVYFPAPGCWEVTGTMATTSLSFVALVIKQG